MASCALRVFCVWQFVLTRTLGQRPHRGAEWRRAKSGDSRRRRRKGEEPRTTLAMSSTLNAIDMTPEETPAAEKPTMTAPDPEEAAAKKPTKRSNSFSRRANRGGKKKEEDAMPSAGGVGGGAAVAPAAGGGAAAVEDTGYVDEEVVAAKPSFKLEKQGNPLTDAIQKEAVELFEAGAYDDAGEKFYYLAEAAHQAGDRQQECTALQNMGTSMVMLGSLFGWPRRPPPRSRSSRASSGAIRSWVPSRRRWSHFISYGWCADGL